MKGKIVYFLTIVICFLLQCTVMDLISIGSVTPNLMLVFCVSMGLMRGRKSGLWAGFFSGLFVDLFFGSVFGFYALIYMYIGYLSGSCPMALMRLASLWGLMERVVVNQSKPCSAAYWAARRIRSR